MDTMDHIIKIIPHFITTIMRVRARAINDILVKNCGSKFPKFWDMRQHRYMSAPKTTISRNHYLTQEGA